MPEDDIPRLDFMHAAIPAQRHANDNQDPERLCDQRIAEMKVSATPLPSCGA
jgi:hypothetical protein